ncbi:hypothetical protein B296_00018458 [Ensete ventricosum]|uniref:Uncharacterized protein n=1 Tax=Ensete ventricosum TaxID=4639 RepID=A0A426XRM3_ENSVE|nr:hypothetical protein B296_00018458 [Ensete ventricosum]
MSIPLADVYLTSHQPSLVRGVVHRLAVASALAHRPLPTGSGGTVRRSAVVFVVTRRLSPAVRGQGAGLARRLCCIARYQGG